MMEAEGYEQMGEGLFVRPEFTAALEELGLTTLDSFFSYSAGRDLSKENLASHRSRMQVQLPDGSTAYLKCYSNPAFKVQLRSWISHKRIGTLESCDRIPADELAQIGIAAPQTLAFGYKKNALLEKRSFILSASVNGEALERDLPDYVTANCTGQAPRKKVDFLRNLASFIKKFHDSGYRHRDLYLSHIFYDGAAFSLIDLHRCFKPRLLARRFRIKDLAQLHYSTPAARVNTADRLRFYKFYTGRKKLTRMDRLTLWQIRQKAWKMAHHDIRHGRAVPFAS